MSISSISEILYSVRDLEAAKILLVTDSGAGAPLARLYLMPKSSLGPAIQALASAIPHLMDLRIVTSRVVTGGQKDTTCGSLFPNDMASCRCREDTILADQQLLNAICGTDFGYQLNNFGIVEASISTNDQKASLNALGYGEEDAGDKGLAVMGLLEDLDLLPKT